MGIRINFVEACNVHNAISYVHVSKPFFRRKLQTEARSTEGNTKLLNFNFRFTRFSFALLLALLLLRFFTDLSWASEAFSLFPVKIKRAKWIFSRYRYVAFSLRCLILTTRKRNVTSQYYWNSIPPPRREKSLKAIYFLELRNFHLLFCWDSVSE